MSTNPISSSSSSSISSVSLGDLGPTGSLQMLFAKLQLELAATAKSQAKEKIEGIYKSQEEQKELAALLNEARECQSEGANGKGVGMSSVKGVKVTGKDCYPMSKALVEYMDEHGLKYPNKDGDYILGKDEWDVAIQALEGRLDTLGTSTQQEMVYIQDYMGQYNSYLQGANTQISNSNQTLTSLARGQ